MNLQRKPSWIPTLALLLLWTQAVFGQTFSSGSTGADGPLNVTSATNLAVKPGGIYHHTTVNIAAGQTLRYFKGSDNAPVVILATGDVTISGVIDVSGFNGLGAGGGSGPQSGAGGGPGGFNGGTSGFSSSTPPITIQPAAGQGPGGGAPSTGGGAQGGSYGAPTAFVVLTPLFGGSGGGGGQAAGIAVGASGGGGGGAVLIASSTRIIVNGQVRANGGNSGGFNSTCTQAGSAGTGGAIRLVAPDISGGGNLQALRGTLTNTGCGQTQSGDGRIRFEALTTSGFTGTTSPVVSVATAPGAVFPTGSPQLSNVPTLQIVSIGSVAVPAAPAASYFTPDIALAPGTSNSVQVVVNATNTPVGAPTAITVKVLPQGSPTNVTVASTDHAGTFASSTATVNVTLPVGQVSVIQASATMTLTGQVASLFPFIDGEPVERVAVASSDGGASTLSLITRSGKEKRLDQLEASDQLRVAQAWEVLKATRSQ